ncbi:DUF1697 domain-containing protein [Okibacterium endophyticum]
MQNKQVALLRGVNVGGVTIRSSDLAAVFRDLGFDDVTTVLASGNVLFQHPSPDLVGADHLGADDTKRTIEQALSDAFGYDAWIVLTDQSSLRQIIDAYPFDEVDTKQPYVMFSSDTASLDSLLAFAATGLDPADERVTAAPDLGTTKIGAGGIIFWEVTRGGSTDTAFARESAKKRYRETTTTRNLRTLRKLV